MIGASILFERKDGNHLIFPTQTQMENTDMALYLCRLDVENLDKNGEPKLVACLGTLHEVAGGYRFIPWNAAHKPSRKTHPEMMKAIPRWADEKHQGFTRLLGRDELTKAQEASI
jgi:hypothetical protein